MLVFSIPVTKEKHTYLINKGNSDVDYFLIGVMVIVLASSVIDRGFDPRSIKPITMKRVLGASPLSILHYGVKSKSNEWLAWSRDTVSKCNNMSYL